MNKVELHWRSPPELATWNQSAKLPSIHDLEDLQVKLGLTNFQVQEFAHRVRQRMGHRGVEAYATQDAVKAGKDLDDFYTTTTVMMEVKKHEEVFLISFYI